MASHLAEEASPPAVSLFPLDSALLVRAAPGVKPHTTLQTVDVDGAAGTVPHTGGMSPSVEFETDLFKGRLQVVLRQPHEHQAPAAQELLRGKQRQCWIMFQVCQRGRALPLWTAAELPLLPLRKQTR